jgi:hypothetical protein
MKRDWLVHSCGLGIGECIDSFDAYHQKSRALSDMTVYVIQMPKLSQLSTDNKRVIKKAITQYFDVIGYKTDRSRVDRFNKYLDKHLDGLFAQLVEFLQNYKVKQYSVDFLIRNFMQDKNGAIVLIDPIVSTELVQALQNIAKNKYGSF